MRKFLLLLLPITSAVAQFGGPCGPDSLLETDCYDAATNNTSCVPCYSQYCVVWDLTWGQACDAFCDSPTTPCSPDRVTITSGAANCTVDLTRCSISYPYLCTLITSETDNCNGELCSQTQGPQYCTNVQPNPTGQVIQQPKNQAACGSGRQVSNRLDRFGPRVESSRPFPIPAGLVLKSRYEVMKRSWRPGEKCLQSKKRVKV